MAALVAIAGREAEAEPAYAVRIGSSWASDEPAIRAGVATPFQQGPVPGAWYAAMAARTDIDPVVVSVDDARTGLPALGMALVLRRERFLRRISFADLDLVDYNAPILGPAAPRDAAGARALWRALRRALPPADLIDFRKMPPRIGGQPNPLALLPTLPCALNGNVVQTGDDYEAYKRGKLRRTVRKELERSWRVFARSEAIGFRTVTGIAERRRVLAAIEAQQPIRMNLTGKNYGLDGLEAAEFYRHLVDADPSGGTVGLSALVAGDEIVAALLGLRDAQSFTMIRLSNSSDPAWTTCSPGRLVIERTMSHLHAEGVREFDFSVGNYDYKRRFCVEPRPLVDLVRPLTPLGWAAAAEAGGRAWLRTRPELEARLRRLLGRTSAEEARP